ncbi:TetR/AcrR family transcriptional regulator [Nocardia salmonicida]|uniref:TetR/AcrR family transcriptional regulator n=1 Tax=Nocardia salmonicida TaxID=53431 RepID=UPI002E2925B5|nr:TetR/AcrR family transcriptional regulator [Nocardia salmonicida]
MTVGTQRHDKIMIRRIARRSQLLDIARDAFVAKGYHGVTMALLARRANVTKPVLYDYFSSKLDLYLAVVQCMLDDLVAAVDRALGSAATDREVVDCTVAVFFDLIDHEGTSRLALVFGGGVPSEPSVDLRVRAALSSCAGTIAERLRPHDGEQARARMLAFGLVGTSLTAASDWHRTGMRIPKHHAVDAISSLCWDGLHGLDTGIT